MQISDENVYALLSCLDIYKSHGPDEINSKILKLLSGNLMLIGAVSNLFARFMKNCRVGTSYSTCKTKCLLFSMASSQESLVYPIFWKLLKK